MIKEALLLMLNCAISSLAVAGNGDYTKGIGKYPGRASENFAPSMVTDNVYRNVALNRAATASSSIDYNLTAQLLTDGITTTKAPTVLTVSTPEGALSLRDKEKTLDENKVTSNFIKGEDTFIQYDWNNGSIHTDGIKLDADVAYHPDKAKSGYEILVWASVDGKKWKTIKTLKDNGLPGQATKQLVSSDPNKKETIEKLPLRKVDVNLQIPSKAYAHIRLQFVMKGCAYWRLNGVDFQKAGNLVHALPSYHFTSVWQATGDKEQWAKIDLGKEVSFDRVNIHWLERAEKAVLQVSADDRTWKNVTTLSRARSLDQQIDCRTTGRYVRLLLQKPSASGVYAISEIEVYGRGGLVAQPAERLGMKDGKYWLNGGDWKLLREGFDKPITATVPGTVLTSYVNIGALPETNFDNNLRQVSESFFNSNFKYTTTFKCPADYQGKQVWLNFNGINWKADILLNGKKIGRIDGAFKRGRFNVTNLLQAGDNELEVWVICNEHFGPVKVKNQETTDLNGGVLGADNPTFHASIGWDWITSTPGREVGLWNDVYLSADKGVSVSDPLLTTKLNLPDTLATLTPSVLVRNVLDRQVTATVNGWVGDIKFSKKVILPANASQEVTFLPSEYAQLRNQRLNLWWPNGYGVPYLYDAGFTVDLDGRSDEVRYKAGIREMSYRDLDTETKIYINGKRLDPLGGNWGFSETNLNYRGREYDAAVRHHREMNFTMIRNWVGQIGDEEFYDACDKYGIMVWQDFWLANPWDGPDPYDEQMFMDNARDYIYRIRNHPSIGIYVGRNEGYPPKTLDLALREAIKKQHPQLDYISSSADDGVSGHGPYRLQKLDWYFENQTHKLHSERGMPNVMNYESLARTLAPEHLWPQSISWGQHDYTLEGAQGGVTFNKLHNDRFGEVENAEEFTRLAQWINYDGHRAMFESAQLDRMGLLMWMSHPCWPSMVWQTYDYYLEPTGGYFGIKKACEPLHIQLNASTKQIQVVNIAKGKRTLKAVAEVLDMNGKVLSTDKMDVTITDDQTLDVMPLRKANLPIYFVRLRLLEGNELVSQNFYVETHEPSDFRRLQSLPKANVSVSQEFVPVGDEYRGTVVLTNRSTTPALLLRLNLKGNDGEQILPAIYSDNYLMLMPGESRTVKVSYRAEDGRGCMPVVSLTGFNVE
ncbi:MAG: glycosyl hydrolase 2 galactose-binding domain-containing protein [Prevotella sp.]|jgi:hypothetical protein